ncbi:MAG: hypothetical protein ACLFTT_10415 [Candidatus Hydrogenedentota bacterium]
MKRMFAMPMLVLLAALVTLGCASTFENPKMAAGEPEHEQLLQDQAGEGETDTMTPEEHRALVREYKRLNREI